MLCIDRWVGWLNAEKFCPYQSWELDWNRIQLCSRPQQLSAGIQLSGPGADLWRGIMNDYLVYASWTLEFDNLLALQICIQNIWMDNLKLSYLGIEQMISCVSITLCDLQYLKMRIPEWRKETNQILLPRRGTVSHATPKGCMSVIKHIHIWYLRQLDEKFLQEMRL